MTLFTFSKFHLHEPLLQHKPKRETRTRLRRKLQITARYGDYKELNTYQIRIVDTKEYILKTADIKVVTQTKQIFYHHHNVTTTSIRVSQ